jgi:hypothetical protein
MRKLRTNVPEVRTGRRLNVIGASNFAAKPGAIASFSCEHASDLGCASWAPIFVFLETVWNYRISLSPHRILMIEHIYTAAMIMTAVTVEIFNTYSTRRRELIANEKIRRLRNFGTTNAGVALL